MKRLGRISCSYRSVVVCSLMSACLLSAGIAHAAVLPYGGTDLRLWLKADGTLNLDPGTNLNRVIGWSDEIGFGGNTLAQDGVGPSGNRPLWVDDVLNGRPVVRFNSGKRRIEGPATSLFSTPGEKTIIVVASSTTGGNRVVFDPNGRAGGASGQVVRITPEMNVRYGNGLTGFTGGQLSSPEIITVQITDGGQHQDTILYRGNTVVTGTSNNPGNAINVGSAGYQLGGTTDLRGDVAEVLVFDAALTTPEFDAIGSYLQQKYGISGGFPTAPTGVFFDDLDPADSDWNSDGNWNTSVRPAASQDATVAGGLTANITQAGAVANQVFVGEGANNGTIIMSSGTWTIDSLLIGNGTSTGLVELHGGTVAINEAGNETQAIQIGNSPGGTGTLTINGATVTTTGGRFEIGGPESAGSDTITAVFNMQSGSVSMDAQNLILGQGNDNSTSTINFSGGTFSNSGGADYNVNDGTAIHNHSDGILTIGDDWALQNGGPATTFELNQSGGTISVDRINGRNGSSTLNVSGGTLEARNGYQSGNNGASRLETFNVSGTGTVVLNGLVNDRNNTTAAHLSGGGRLEITGSDATREFDTFSMAGSSVLQLDLVNNTTGVSAPLNAKVSATFTDSPTLEIVDKVDRVAATGTIDTWNGGTDIWDNIGTKWDLGYIPEIAKNPIPDGATFDVITSPNSMTANPLLTSGTAGWTVLTPDANTVQIKRDGDLPGGTVTAAIDNAASIVTRNSDLRIAAETGADAARLDISNGSLTLTGASELILGGGAKGTVNQDGGTVTIAGNLRFGPAPGDDGGTYNLTGGVLNVAGDVIESNAAVDTANLYVDGGTLNVAGNITVQTFRTGHAAGTTGAYTVSTGQTLTTTGTLAVAESGTGILTVEGGIVTADNARIGGKSGSDGTLDIKSGEFHVTGADLRVAAVGGSSGTVLIGVGGGSPTVTVSGGNFETAESGTGVVQMDSGTVTQLTDNFIVGQDSNSNATFTLNGGTVDLRPAFVQNPGSHGDFNLNKGVGLATLNGGELITGDDVRLSNGGSGTSTLTVNGATLRVTNGAGGSIDYRGSANATDVVNLQAGLIATEGGSILFANATDRFNLSGGVLDMGGGSIVATEATSQFVFNGGVLKNLGAIGHADATFTTPDISGTGTPQDGKLAANEVLGAMGVGNLVAGKLGGAIDHDGDDDYIDFGKGSVLGGDVTVPVFSLSLWFQRDEHVDPATNHDVNNTLVAHSGTGNDHLEVGSEGTTLEAYVDMNGNTEFTGPVPDFAVQDDTWHHMVVTFDANRTSDEAHFWLDGELVPLDLGDNAAGLAKSPEGLSLGIARQATDRWGDLDGKLDDFALWSRVLSDTEVAALYNGGAGAAVDTLTDWQLNLDIYTPMDQLGVGGTPVPLVQGGGILAPGDPVGTTAVLGDYLMNDGIYQVDIAGPDNGDNDLVEVFGAADLNGLVEIMLEGGHVPGGGNLYDVLTATGGITLGSDFGLIEPSAMPAGMSFQYELVNAGTTLQLSAVVPEPGTWILMVLGAFGSLFAVRSRKRGHH
ncbi:MAG: PEP-CTERM sorting domain-containing protein [Planctomycetes bacterium]|nr:PEP-CTERM sorting domain-containing protein [Planctomycetota bacterium]